MRKFFYFALLAYCVPLNYFFLSPFSKYLNLSKCMSYIPVQSVGQHILQNNQSGD